MATDRRAYYREYNKKHGDRHRKGYYHEYNAAHPERLNRGYTKGYVNGNVSEGRLDKKDWLNKALGVYVVGHDEFGMPITNDAMTNLLIEKEWQWHDDDWCEGTDDD